MKSLEEEFLDLSPSGRRFVHFFLCRNALKKWTDFVAGQGVITYAESVCGTEQTVDKDLPALAFESARQGKDLAEVKARYVEPIVAMQDSDLVFADGLDFVYYAIYNLFRKYGLQEETDDWLIVNQSLSAETEPERMRSLLQEAIQGGREADPSIG